MLRSCCLSNCAPIFSSFLIYPRQLSDSVCSLFSLVKWCMLWLYVQFFYSALLYVRISGLVFCKYTVGYWGMNVSSIQWWVNNRRHVHSLIMLSRTYHTILHITLSLATVLIYSLINHPIHNMSHWLLNIIAFAILVPFYSSSSFHDHIAQCFLTGVFVTSGSTVGLWRWFGGGGGYTW